MFMKTATFDSPRKNYFILKTQPTNKRNYIRAPSQPRSNKARTSPNRFITFQLRNSVKTVDISVIRELSIFLCVKNRIYIQLRLFEQKRHGHSHCRTQKWKTRTPRAFFAVSRDTCDIITSSRHYCAPLDRAHAVWQLYYRAEGLAGARTVKARAYIYTIVIVVGTVAAGRFPAGDYIFERRSVVPMCTRMFQCG